MIPADALELYRATARQRELDRQEAIIQRHERAMTLASTAAQLLRQRFGAERVIVFGSVAQPELFHERSDIDLAVWGVDEADYLRAVAALIQLSPEFEMDLIRWESAPASLRQRIVAEGVGL